MKKKLTVKEYVYVASMLFGLFFGAGNLIFPTAVGQLAGRNMWSAIPVSYTHLTLPTILLV